MELHNTTMNECPAGTAARSHPSRMTRFGVEAMVFPLIAMLLTAGAVIGLVPVKYFARAIVESAPGRNNTVGAAFDMLPEEMARLQGEETLDRVIDRLDLTEAYGHLGGTVSRQEARDRLAGSIRVREALEYESLPGWDLQTPLIEIGVFDINARRAADIANGMAEIYRDERLGEIAMRAPATVIRKKAELSYEPEKPDLMLWLGVAASVGALIALVVARHSTVTPRFSSGPLRTALVKP
jgi:hypothetical protein